MKMLFERSRDSLGSRGMMKKLREEGLEISRYKVRNLMRQLSLKWMYLAMVMDLYSSRIVGWYISKCMTTDLISRAMMMAYNLR
jgi:putative transposase